MLGGSRGCLVRCPGMVCFDGTSGTSPGLYPSAYLPTCHKFCKFSNDFPNPDGRRPALVVVSLVFFCLK